MSCARTSSRLARLAGRISAGVSQLAGRRGFYAGLALGAAGLTGAGLVAVARRRSDQGRPIPAITLRPLPKLPSRSRVGPMAPDRLRAARCAGCQATPERKPGGWYMINSRSYCQDCAPEAARQAEVELVGPAAPVSSEPVLKRLAGSTPGGSSTVPPLPPEGRIETRLVPSRVRVNANQSPDEPAWVVLDQAYVVLKKDGGDTGLAIIPAMTIRAGREGISQVEEDTSRWRLIHIQTGLPVGNQLYEKPEVAQKLAGYLGQLDWTRERDEISYQELRQASATISWFNQALATARTQANPVGGPNREAGQSANPVSRRPRPGEPLAGKLMVDGWGGVGRVIEAEGETIFMINSLGERYEVPRAQIRTPDQADFEGVRVAMPFDPAANPEMACARCGRSSREIEAGEQWHKMSWQPYCPGCAQRHAAEEAYALAEEIGL